RHGPVGDAGHLAVGLDAPALGHAVAAGGQGEERRQLDDLGVAVVLAQLLVDLVVAAVVEGERARVMQRGARARVGMLPVGQRAAAYLLVGDRLGQRRALAGAELAL